MTLSFCLCIALLMFIVCSLLIWSSRRSAEAQARNLLAATTIEVRQYIADNVPVERLSEITDAHNGEGGSGEIALWVLGPDQKVLWRSRPPAPHFNDSFPGGVQPGGSQPPPPPPPFDGPFRDDGGRGNFRGGPGRPPWWHIRSWFPFFGPPRPPRFDGRFRDPNSAPPLFDPQGWRSTTVPWNNSTVLIGVPWHKEDHALRDQALSLYVLSLCVIGATAVGAWFLVGRTLMPLTALAQQARQSAQRATNSRTLEPMTLSSPSHDREMRELVDMLNELLNSVFGAARSKEQFHTAASHELRTPLQALSGHLQVALSRERSAEDYRAALAEAATQTDRLTELVRDLLLLNQLHMATTRPADEKVNLAEVCDLVLSQLERNISAARVSFEENLGDVEVDAPPMQLTMLLRNLTENAIKYARPGSTLLIETTTAPARFSVLNQIIISAGGEAPQPEKWFEPFFRPDESRTGSTGGNGLGLAICKAICDANGWTIEINYAEDGVRATVFFDKPA